MNFVNGPHVLRRGDKRNSFVVFHAAFMPFLHANYCIPISMYPDCMRITVFTPGGHLYFISVKKT
jgi:hypothetical protein